MKKSVNFNGMKRWRGANAGDLLATLRFLGMSDEEIKAKMLEIKAAREKAACPDDSEAQSPKAGDA